MTSSTKEDSEDIGDYPYPPFPGPGYPCPGQAMAIWVNLTSVRVALNVPTNSYFFSGDNGDGFNYTLTEPDLRPFYGSLIKNSTNKLRILIYNGDTDPGINSFITQDIFTDYLKKINVPQISTWKPWTIDGKANIAGYLIQYSGNFTYLTIRGSGHMVPEYKPIAAITMLKAFLFGSEYPPYNP